MTVDIHVEIAAFNLVAAQIDTWYCSLTVEIHAITAALNLVEAQIDARCTSLTRDTGCPTKHDS